MKLRRTVTLGLAAALLLSGCTDDGQKTPDGQAVEIVAGGGSDPKAVKALDAQLTGTIDDFDIGRDGVIRVMTTENGRVTIRLIRPDGELQRVDLDPKVKTADQLAVADDGTMYVSHSPIGAGLVSRVLPDGRLTTVLGNGRPGFTPDGGTASGPAGAVTGIAVDREGRLLYGEALAREGANRSISLLRRIEVDGRVKTVGGRPAALSSSDEYQQAVIKSVSPPDGTRALEWTLPGAFQLSTLAVEDDGTVVAQGAGGVLAFPVDGTVRPIARRRDPEAAPVGDRPFGNEGDPADAAPRFLGAPSGVSVGGGYVAMVVQAPRPDRPAAFRWAGGHASGQQTILDVTDPQNNSTALIVRLVRPDNTLTTAAWGVQGAAVWQSQLYVAISAGNQSVIGRVALPG